MEVIIEQLSRSHKLISRHKFDDNEVINVGRGYTNDIIVAEPHVCAEHLRLTFDGYNWHVLDRGSINGSFIEATDEQFTDHIIQSGDIICIGKCLIRLILPDHPVAETVRFSPFERLVDFARQPLIMTLNLLLFLAIAAWTFYLNKPTEVNWQHIAAPALGMTLGFTAWPILVSLVSQFTKNEARILYQVGISFVFFNLMWFSEILESIVNFNSSAHWSIAQVVTLIPIALAFCLFWLNCYIGFHMKPVRRIVAATCLTTLLFGGTYLVQLSKKPEFSPLPSYDATLMVPALLFAPSTDVDSFVNDTKALFEQTQKEAAKEKAKKERVSN